MSTSAINIGFELDRYPTLLAFAQSEALIRFTIGPAGSAKTSYCAMELLRLAMSQEPAEDNTRYFRACIIRNTYQLLRDNTVNTFKQMYGPLYKGTMGTQPRGRVEFGLPDGTRVDFEILYLAMDSEDALSKLLGMEVTFFMLDELSELSESLVFSCVQRLGRYPSGAKGKVTRTGIIGATNGPMKSHWLYQWYTGKHNERFEQVAKEMGIARYMEIFKQPPALLRPADPDGKWLPNPAAENVHNLAQGYGYYFAMLGNSDDAKIKAYVEGDFSDLKSGRVVFPEFHRDIHTAPHGALRPAGSFAYFLSFDFGRTPACLLSYMTMDGGVVVLDEFVGADMSVDQLFKQVVLPRLKREYAGCVCAGAWGDPAGMAGGQNVDLSPFDVLRKQGVPITAPAKTNALEPRLEAVRRMLTRLGSGGKPMLMVSEQCPLLINAMATDYIYPHIKGSRTLTAETPTKSHENWVSDICDCLQYLCLGILTVDKPDYSPPPAAQEVDWYS